MRQPRINLIGIDEVNTHTGWRKFVKVDRGISKKAKRTYNKRLRKKYKIKGEGE